MIFYLFATKTHFRISFSKLVDLDLAKYENGEMVLSEAENSSKKNETSAQGNEKIYNQNQNKPTFLDELLGEL